MIDKNGIYSGEVSGYGTEGEGIIKMEGTTAFVPFCVSGEEVRFKALKVKDDGKTAYGKLEEVLRPSPARVKAPCPVYGKCGGCDLQHMDYEEELSFKRELVKNSLAKIGGICAEVSPVVPCRKQYRYRNKLVLPIGTDERGETVLGFYARRSHRIIPVDDCLIQSEWFGDIVCAIKNFARASRLKGYDEVKKTGVLRHLIVREEDKKFIIALVATKRIDLRLLTEELKKKFENFTLLLNVNNSESNVIFSKEWHICFGEGFFQAEDCGIKYRAGAETFLQVNDGVRARLYARVLKEAEEENTAAIDLYSGGGMLTAMLAKACGKAYGVEIVEEASRCADELIALNGLEGKMFNICGSVEKEIDEVFKMTEGQKRVIVCDPPRKGMERSVVLKLKNCGADKIILISCNPATLSRDLGILTGTLAEVGGVLRPVPFREAVSEYKIDSVTPFDMFPQTKHVETLVVLSKNNKRRRL